ncbi:bacterial translation initiation factor 2 (bIF-2) [Nitrosococcus oceani ATCC 19707]|uniref:Translation initiation factor IF-2 n=1 Tax=Nitrosococcus oceani (strain ATCC 19707 / BCRC 17464 / JCM 30415 / NCIMB 11848 / C-107) TaxID=323261 RepID=IF2_NITOC|nr:translation initiation factor IF-2 [Nitrosococcus oceani]Q3J9B6.1 RecName: Full=Translation initiation factor IF-2 [Nitrosococcus oceani ATCC 19707]ABA58580.1 bacterial translation initiation factor 2 (bIF-2) [Nitrosococcus oceani ATCC 19707]GEM19699.1 translation initiation factor IF-2 [Nitrosococcus oceani]
MSEVTVRQLADVVGTPVGRLLEQLREAGIGVDREDAAITEAQKLQLLRYLRHSHGASVEIATPKRITLNRRSHSEIQVNAGGGRSKTVNVEVRKKRTYIKRSAILEQERLAERQREEEEAQAGVQAQQEREARLIAEEEAKRQAAEEEAKRQAAEEEAKRQAAEEEAKRQAEAQVKRRLDVEKKPKNGLEPARTEKPASRKAKPRFRSEDRESEQKQRGTKFGRKELHIAPGKAGTSKRKKFRPQKAAPAAKHGFERPTAPIVHDVSIPETMTVAELAQKMSVKAAEVIKALMKLGIMATINQVLDQDTATIVVEEMGHKPKRLQENTLELELVQAEQEVSRQVSRAAVVTIMGHVDHGKTSLLDYIRRAKVATSEAGGITQHIGAYKVRSDKGEITFIDTPGHAAFTAMRARGAKVTDIVILVVAADDGAMPQTVEAIQHARAAGAPLVVAVNKIDRPDADPDRVKQELANHDVITEEWGGDTQFVNVSAKTGEGIDDLIEAILLQAEVMEIKVSAEGPARGVVIESRLDKGRGPVATILVQSGTLRKGDILLSGVETGRVRAMLTERGQEIIEAGPSTPVEILGLSGTPNAGDEAVVVPDERRAREIAGHRQAKEREVKLARQQSAKLENMFNEMEEGEIRALNLVIKADVQGSAEALSDSLTKLSTDKARVKVVAAGVGGINETDVNLAVASNAVIIGFNVRADAAARRLIAEKGIDLHYYSVIYNAIDEIKGALIGILDPEYREEIIGLARVDDVFRSPKLGAIAGCLVIEGSVRRNNPIRVLRDNIVVFEGQLESLRRFKDDVQEVRAGTECGIGVKDYKDVKVGDQIEVYERVRKEPAL